MGNLDDLRLAMSFRVRFAFRDAALALKWGGCRGLMDGTGVGSSLLFIGIQCSSAQSVCRKLTSMKRILITY